MAVITNYATLQTEIANTLARSDLTSDIPLFIQAAENEAYRTLNLRNEETALNVTITGGVAAVPADFKALKFAYIDGSPIRLLEWVSINELYRDYPDRSAGTPSVISREAGNFVFGPVAGTGDLKGVYYAKQDPLRTTDPSWYVTNAPEVLLYGALFHAAVFIQDANKAAGYRQLFDAGMNSLKTEQSNAEVSKGNLTIRANASNNP